MRAAEFTEDNFGTHPRRPARKGSRPPRGHEPVPRYRTHKSEVNELAPTDRDDDDNEDGALEASFTVFKQGKAHTGTVVVYPGTVTEVEYHLDDKVYRKSNMQNVDDYDDFIEDAAGYIQEIAQLNGDGNHSVESAQLNELMFMNMSPCKTDCSGHRAGYRWSKARGGVSTASWSDSFNRGAEIAKAGY